MFLSKIFLPSPFCIVFFVVCSFQFLPTDFHKVHHIKKSCEVILRVSNVGTWPVDLNYFSEGKKAKFGRGWMEVVRDNNLESGDVCVFVSINNSAKPLFDVVFFRSGQAAKRTNIDREKTVPAEMEENVDAAADSVQNL